MDALSARADRVLAVFTEVHERAFRGDPVSNPRLRVEVVGAALAGDTPVLVLVTPWTINGLAFPPDGDFPDRLELNGRDHPVWDHDLDEIGPYRMVNLLGTVSCLESPAQARELATAMAEPFRRAVAAVRGAGPAPEPASVPDPSRRRLLLLREV